MLMPSHSDRVTFDHIGFHLLIGLLSGPNSPEVNTCYYTGHKQTEDQIIYDVSISLRPNDFLCYASGNLGKIEGMECIWSNIIFLLPFLSKTSFYFIKVTTNPRYISHG